MTFSNHAGGKRHCTKINKKETILQAFDSRIIGIIKEFVQSINTPLPAFVRISAFILLLTSPEQTTLTGFQQGDADPDTGEMEEQGRNSSSANQSKNIEIDEDYEKCAIIYVRVSSSEQKSEGRSLESQEEELTSIVEQDHNMRMYTSDAIQDGGETGTDFDREGIKKVLELAHKEEPTHLLVDSIDRIGRNVIDTLRFIQVLREECDVKIMTRTRELDIFKPTDKMQLTILALMADFGTMARARSARRSKVDNFLNEKKWFSWYNSVPIGYKKEGEDAENGDDAENNDVWIQRIDELEPVIEDTYDFMIREECYEKVARVVTKKHRNLLREYDLIDEQSGGEDEENNRLQGRQIKRVLTNPVYIGQPIVPVTDLEHHGENPHVKDLELQFVSEDKFDRVQGIVADIKEKNSTESALTLEPQDYSQEFSSFTVDTTSPLVQLRCPDCDEDLNSNGQISVDGNLAFRYYSCPDEECDFGRRWPNEGERDTMKMLKNIDDYKALIGS